MSLQTQLAAWHGAAADALRREAIQYGEEVSMAGFISRLRALLPEDALIIPLLTTDFTFRSLPGGAPVRNGSGAAG